jgi:hypothetical protein
MDSSQLLEHIDRRLAEGRTADLRHLVYHVSCREQFVGVIEAALDTGCAFSFLGPDDDGATVFVQGSPQELRQCAEAVNRLPLNAD